MNHALELVPGLPRKELIEKIYFHHRQGEIAARALGFYLLEMETSEAFRPGCRDAAHWALKHLGLRRAERLILIARRLATLPEIDRAFERGELPWTKVREIARVAVPETEADWLDFARRSTSREIEDAVSGVKPGQRPGEGLKSDRTRYRVTLPFTGEELAFWELAIRTVLARL